MIEPITTISSIVLAWIGTIELRLRGLNKVEAIAAVQEEIKKDIHRIDGKLDRLIERKQDKGEL